MGGTGLRAVTTYPTSFRAYEVWDYNFNRLCGLGHLLEGVLAKSSDCMYPPENADDSLPSPSLTIPPRHPAALGENRRLSLRPYLHIVVCGSYPFRLPAYHAL